MSSLAEHISQLREFWGHRGSSLYAAMCQTMVEAHLSELEGLVAANNPAPPLEDRPMLDDWNPKIPKSPATPFSSVSTPPTSQSGVSRCDQCGAEYPSAPKGVIHKCGKCSGGMCKPINSQSDEALVEELRLIAVWHTPGAKTPAQPMPDVAKVCQMAAEALSVSGNCDDISDARIASARAEGRREGIEEAAKVADDLWDRVAGNSERKLHQRMAYRQVAASIRALAEQQS